MKRAPRKTAGRNRYCALLSTVLVVAALVVTQGCKDGAMLDTSPSLGASRGVVSGRVLWQGAPVAEAVVTDGYYTTTSSSTGGYTLPNVRIGTHTIYAYKNGKGGYAEVTVSPSSLAVSLDISFFETFGVLRGQVADSDTELPIPLADVTLDEKTVLTDAGGWFFYILAASGSPYELTVQKTGYVKVESSGVTVTAQQETELSVRMAKDENMAVVAGTVTDSNTTDPVTGATVSFIVAGGSAPMSQTTTTTDGSYLAVLPFGNYTIQASNTGYHDATSILQLSGDATGQDIQISPTGNTLAGTVRSSVDFSSVEGVLVEVVPAAGGQSVATVTGNDGTYSLSLAAGTYNATFTRATYKTEKVQGLDVSLSDLRQDVELTPVYTLGGTVSEITTGQGLAGATVEVYAQGETSPTAGPVLTATDGTYTLSVPRGMYTITVTLTSYQVGSRQLSVTSDLSTVDFSLVYAGSGEQMTVEAYDLALGNNQAGRLEMVTVMLAIDGEDHYSGVTVADGTCIIPGVVPGRYQVTAERGGFRDTVFEQVVSLAGETVEIPLVYSISATTGTIVGVVTNESNDPGFDPAYAEVYTVDTEGKTIFVNHADLPALDPATRSSSFVVRDIPAGTILVQITDSFGGVPLIGTTVEITTDDITHLVHITH